MLQKLAYVLALGPSLWMATAQALGLGEVDVRSKLNQRFSASIPVVSANPDEIEGLTVKLAGSEDFARSGIERADYLSTLEFTLVTVADGAQVRITSKQVARDPFLNFIVEGRWRGGRVLREYTVLLDPASAADAELIAPPAVAAKPAQTLPAPATAAASVAPPPAPKSTPSPPAAKPKAASTPPKAPTAATPTTEPSTSASASVPGSYGPVNANETLWAITNKLRPPGVTLDQMLLALYENNPQGFEGGINGLLKGVRLTVPGLDKIKAVDAATAKAKVDELRNPGATAALPAPKPATAATPPAVKPVEPAPAAAAPKPEVSAPAVPKAGPNAAPPVAGKPPAAETPPKLESPSPKIETPLPVAPSVGPSAASGAQPEAPAAAPVPPPPAAVATPAPKSAPTAEGEDFFQTYKLPLIGVFAVLALGIVGFISRRRKTEEPRRRLSTSPVLVRPLDSDFGGLPGPADGGSDDHTRAEREHDEQAAEMRGATETEKATSSNIAPADAEYATPGAAHAVGMNLDANDPMTEASFHLSYGLYDEAAQMLKQAAAKDPDRLELRTKLAETYFAAGKPMEFQETAESLQGRITAAEWQKIAALGRQLCPDVGMFQSADGGAGTSAAKAPLGMSVIDFDLDKEMAELPPTQSPMIKPPAPKGEGISSLDLTQFDLGPEAAATVADPLEAVDFNIDELDLGKADEGDATMPLGDEVDTKLDLARAYADMGDNEAARNLLLEVLQTGTDKQKQEAENLNQRLTA